MINDNAVGEKIQQPGIYQAVPVHCWDGLGGSRRLEKIRVPLICVWVTCLKKGSGREREKQKGKRKVGKKVLTLKRRSVVGGQVSSCKLLGCVSV